MICHENSLLGVKIHHLFLQGVGSIFTVHKMKILLSTKIMMDMFNFSFHVWRKIYLDFIHFYTIFNVDSLWEIGMCMHHKMINYIRRCWFLYIIQHLIFNKSCINKMKFEYCSSFYFIAFQNFSLPQLHFLSQQHLNNDILKILHMHKYIESWRLHNCSFFPSLCNIQNHA